MAASMTGVLVVGHGSRQRDTEQTLEAVVEMTRAMLPGILIEIAYMEIGEKTIPAGLAALVAKDVDEIVVAPYFLFEGIHIRQDIPRILAEYRQAHPNIKMTMAGLFGADVRLAAILADRVKECLS
jgi:sirohydrochlorin ferrochelatase